MTSEKPLSVRPATPDDEEKIFNLLLMAYHENAPYRINEKKVRLMISSAARDLNVIVGVIDSPDGKEIAGSIGAFFSQWWYTDDWHIEECWNFVHPDHRKSSNAKDLLQYAKWISDKMDMPLHIGIMTSTRLEAKTRLYQRHLPQVGAAFAYNIKMGHGPISAEMTNE